MSVETTTPERLSTCLTCGAPRPAAACTCAAAGGPTALGRPLALSPAVDRWTAATLLRRAAGPLGLRAGTVSAAISPGRLRPVLLPAWSLDVTVRSNWTCGEERSGSRRQTRRGLVLPGVTGTAAAVVGAAFGDGRVPTEMPAAELSDWSPLGVTRPLASAWSTACAHLAATAAEDAALGLSLDETERLAVETRFDDQAARPLLVPAWKATIGLPGSETTVFVEACGGKVVGSFPWNGLRLAGLAAGAGIVLGLAWTLLFRG